MVACRLRIGDHKRSFALRKPPGAGAGELPLVIVLHGHGPDASGATMRGWTSFDAHADEWGIAVAYPDGYRGGWADGRGVTAADADGVDDVAFLCALIDWSAERHGTRADHTIIAGVSNGAIMAHRLALQASERVAAFGAVAGALPDRPDWLGLTRHIITGGVGGTKVATLTVRGGGHAWPGSAPVSDPRVAAAIGPIAQNIDAAAEIVRFACPMLDARTRRR
jgi:polyhydroxybutyrate depolymerase